MLFKEKLFISSDLSFFNRKNLENFQKNHFLGKKFMKINFSPIYSEILKTPPEYKIVDYKLSITKQPSDFQNFSVVFDIEPKNQIFTYLVKTGLLANLEQELYVVKFWAISSS